MPSAPTGTAATLAFLVTGATPPQNAAPTGALHTLRFDVLGGAVPNRPPVGANLSLQFVL